MHTSLKRSSFEPIYFNYQIQKKSTIITFTEPYNFNKNKVSRKLKQLFEFIQNIVEMGNSLQDEFLR